MKKLILTLSAIGTLIASAETQNEINWAALVAATPKDAQINVESATAIKQSILNSATITAKELSIAQAIARITSVEAERQLVSDIATSDKSGEGVIAAKAIIKYWNKDGTGWTAAMIEARFDLAAAVAVKPSATEDLKQRVFDKIKDKPCFGYYEKMIFKHGRQKLSKSAQVELTAVQKQIMIALANRSTSANAWLAEISADLIALQLD